MCCGARACTLCICLIAVVVVVGVFFGFGVYKDGFHKLKEVFHACDPSVAGSVCGRRPFVSYAPPPSSLR
uniref:Uncharacterized protein n=1 Tax=Kalanchoe fedtschenkoi TaxID=63787 RepID=A0A7N0ZY82_KALFE